MNKIFLFAFLVAIFGFVTFRAADAMPRHKSAGSAVSQTLNSGEENVLVAEAEATPLSTEQMDKTRGGWIDASGILYSFVVNVRTDVNGAEVFSKSLALTSMGQSNQFQLSSSGGVLTQNAPAGATIITIGNNSGAVVTYSDGSSTTFYNQNGNGAPLSLVANSANNQKISQTVNAALTLQSLPTMVNALRSAGQNVGVFHPSSLRSVGF